MEQEHSDIDDLLKKLHSYQGKPMANSWEKISASLEEDEKKVLKLKRNRRIYLIGIAASVAVMVSLALFILSNTTTNNTPTASAIIRKENPVKEINKTAPENSSVSENDQEKAEAPKIVRTTPSSELIAEKATDRKREIILPDGSKVYINRNSEITYYKNFTKERVIHLQGEAFFEVKPNNGQPFVVYANFSKTEVIGTSFMIRAVKPELMDELFVSSGKVAFSALSNDEKKIYLTEGECSKTSATEQPQASPVTDINYAAWKTEKIVFNNTKLAQVTSTLEKYYATSIKISNEEILNCRFTGTFKKSTIDQVLQVLAISLDLSFSKEDKGYILVGKGCQ